ncbi:hypothetical protein IW262DRAFT_511675 [Armillaria fumosa]|nr:hypothetical protein IW262DRAFT_511675 [Armillaria fumosa]
MVCLSATRTKPARVSSSEGRSQTLRRRRGCLVLLGLVVRSSGGYGGPGIVVVTPMGRPVTYSCMCYCSVHRDGHDGAGLRCLSSCVGSPCNLPIRDAGLGASGANERCVPSMPPYHGGVVLCGRLLGATAHIRDHRGSAHRLKRRERYTACHPGLQASAAPSRRGVQAAHGSVRLVLSCSSRSTLFP